MFTDRSLLTDNPLLADIAVTAYIYVLIDISVFTDTVVTSSVLCLGQDFWGTLVSPYLNFRGTFANSGGHTKSI